MREERARGEGIEGRSATSPRSSTRCTRRSIDLHTKIKYRWDGVDEKGKPVDKWYETTPGRVLLGQVLPQASRRCPSTSSTS